MSEIQRWGFKRVRGVIISMGHRVDGEWVTFIALESEIATLRSVLDSKQKFMDQATKDINAKDAELTALREQLADKHRELVEERRNAVSMRSSVVATCQNQNTMLRRKETELSRVHEHRRKLANRAEASEAVVANMERCLRHQNSWKTRDGVWVCHEDLVWLQVGDKEPMKFYANQVRQHDHGYCYRIRESALAAAQKAAEGSEGDGDTI